MCTFFSVRISCSTRVLRYWEMTSVRMERVLVVLRWRMRVRRLQSLGIRRLRRRSLMLHRGSWLVDWEVWLLRRWSRGCWSDNGWDMATLGWGTGRNGIGRLDDGVMVIVIAIFFLLTISIIITLSSSLPPVLLWCFIAH